MGTTFQALGGDDDYTRPASCSRTGLRSAIFQYGNEYAFQYSPFHIRWMRSTKAGGPWSTKTPLVGLIERGGEVRVEPVERVTKRSIERIIKRHTCGPLLMSDRAQHYKLLDTMKVDHGAMFVDGNIHINNIQSFWATVKRGILGQFHWLSKRYLQYYANEFAWRFNRRKQRSTFGELLGLMVETA